MPLTIRWANAFPLRHPPQAQPLAARSQSPISLAILAEIAGMNLSFSAQLALAPVIFSYLTIFWSRLTSTGNDGPLNRS